MRESIHQAILLNFVQKSAKITTNKHFRLFAMFVAADKLNSMFIHIYK